MMMNQATQNSPTQASTLNDSGLATRNGNACVIEWGSLRCPHANHLSLYDRMQVLARNLRWTWTEVVSSFRELDPIRWPASLPQSPGPARRVFAQPVGRTCR